MVTASTTLALPLTLREREQYPAVLRCEATLEEYLDFAEQCQYNVQYVNGEIFSIFEEEYIDGIRIMSQASIPQMPLQPGGIFSGKPVLLPNGSILTMPFTSTALSGTYTVVVTRPGGCTATGTGVLTVGVPVRQLDPVELPAFPDRHCAVFCPGRYQRANQSGGR
ncbi:MAG: hypothetical protein LH609_10295 [Rudanella sp.]|nr:hypothetical protein [Rudanella sp.]